MKVMTRKPEIYDAERLAEFFQVSLRTIREWCRDGKLPAFKIGKDWKIRVSDLQKLIDRKVAMKADRENSAKLF
jgi:excisionase family DNA binding protein